MSLWGAATYANQQPGLERKPNLENHALHPGRQMWFPPGTWWQHSEPEAFCKSEDTWAMSRAELGLWSQTPRAPISGLALAVSVALGKIVDLLSPRFFSCKMRGWEGNTRTHLTNSCEG